ncbi:PPE family protein [Mycobacterium sp.]|uniref:PPE family protein n=1 Tax=Mycobacterium sp. TaxID=1785 RepID=UPI003D128916
MDFATLPPEVNSGLMYTGPGSGPMIAAAASWDNLATEVASAAGDYGSVISGLTSGPWRGPASSSMVAAAAPYVSWMNATAEQAEQAASQAKAAASAYEAAFSATVAPPVIAANRTLLASLVATNILGQNTPAIATTEAHYAEMWAQDAAAMYGYAGSSAAATTLTPFLEPPATTTVGQATGAGTSSSLSQLVTSVPAALQGLASPATSSGSASGLQGLFDLLSGNSTSTSGLSGIFADLFSSNGLGLNANIWNTIFSSGFYTPANTLGAFTSLFGGGAAGDAAAGAGQAAAAADGIAGAVAAPAAGLGELGGLGGSVSAAVGRGSAIGALTVPPGWTAVAPTVNPLSGLSGAALGGMPPAPPPAVAAGIPGMSSANAAGNRFGTATPRYGIRPTVMAHPPAAG